MNTKRVELVCRVLVLLTCLLGIISSNYQSAQAQEGIIENIWIAPNQYFVYASGYTWGHGTVVDLTVTRAGTTYNFPSAIVEQGPGNPGFPIHYPDEVAYFDLYQMNPPFELLPGDVITLIGGDITRTMIVPPFKITYVEVSSGTISGTGAVGSLVRLGICNQNIEGQALPDLDGNWTIVFGPGFISPDACGGSTQVDADGNTTQQGWGAPDAYFTQEPSWAPLGNSITLDASRSFDWQGQPLTYEWDLDDDGAYDDATGVTTTVAFDHVGRYMVGMRVTNSGGLMRTTENEIAFYVDQNPIVGSITAPLSPVPVGTIINTSASFTGPSLDVDTFTAEWDWGDGSTSPGTVVDYDVTGSHQYTIPGVYTLKLTVRDAVGFPGRATYQYVVVYDPDGGFVTGGGWITSPPGAYVANPDLTGKATFGFVSKYLKGAKVPTGNTEFQFKAGDLNFKSISYEWLVVAGNKAQFKGVGTINGSGSYKFMLWADDDSPDTFRIQIWSDTGTVYDNGSQQALGGGSIVVHK